MTEPNASASPAAPKPARLLCAGRFAFSLPAQWTRQGQQQSIYLLRVWTEPLPDKATPAQLLRHHAGQGGGTVTEQGGLAGGILLAHQRPQPEGAGLRAVALLPQGGTMLLGQMETTAQRVDAAHQVMAQVLPSWRAQAETGFCLESGALTIAPSRNERARIAFSGPGGLSGWLQTETVAQPVALPDEASDAEDARGLALGGGQLKLLSRADRALAGLPGRERLVQVQAKPQAAPELIYTWDHAGAAADPLRPHIRLQLQGPADQKDQLAAAWALLSSTLARRP
jgi:hypothetical protein